MKNEYEVRGDTVVIHIKRRTGERFEALISIEDLPDLLNLPVSWCIADNRQNRGGYYVYCRLPRTKPQQNIRLHQFILNKERGQMVDHINGNGLDNRRLNLRLATDTLNNQNRTKVNSNSSTKIRGVSWHKQQQKWRAYLTMNYRQKSLGLYTNIEDAEAAAKKARARFMPYSSEAMEYRSSENGYLLSS